MESKFSPQVRDIISFSREEALRNGNDYIGIEHLFLGMIREGEGRAIKILVHLGLDMAKIKTIIENTINSSTKQNRSAANLPLVKQAEKVLKITYLEAKLFNSELIRTEHLMLSILKDSDNLVTKLLSQQGVDYELFKDEVQNWSDNMPEDRPIPGFKGDLSQGNVEDEGSGESSYGSGQKKATDKSKTPVLDSFGRDLTRAAEENRLDPVVGRERELERIAQILSRRKKNNPILIGEPGVGKSAIAKVWHFALCRERFREHFLISA